jgi:hypothetical protein
MASTSDRRTLHSKIALSSIFLITANNLKGNDEKTDAFVVHSDAEKCKTLDLPFFAGTLAITPPQFMKNLSVILDSQLTMNDQIMYVYQKSYSHISRIARIRKCLTWSSAGSLSTPLSRQP